MNCLIAVSSDLSSDKFSMIPPHVCITAANSQSWLWWSWLPHHSALKDSHNSPEYCPCPVDPRKSACSVTVHCCGCRGPSVLRGPVELLEEAVPDELWPPGDGKDGLLYGRHPSSGDINAEHALRFCCCSEMHLRSVTQRQRAILTLLTSAEQQCQQALPNRGHATEDPSPSS